MILFFVLFFSWYSLSANDSHQNEGNSHTHRHTHTPVSSLYTHRLYLVSEKKININTQFIYLSILFLFLVFTRSMTNPLCHITFSVKLKEKLKTIKSILIILRPVRRGFLFFRFWFFFLYWLKTKALSHTPIHKCMGLRPTQVKSFANIFYCHSVWP